MNLLIIKCCLKKPTLNPTPPSRYGVSYMKLIVHEKWVTVRHVITEDLEVYQPVMVWSLYSIFFPSSLCWILRGNSMWVNSLPNSSGLRKPCKEQKNPKKHFVSMIWHLWKSIKAIRSITSETRMWLFLLVFDSEIKWKQYKVNILKLLSAY